MYYITSDITLDESTQSELEEILNSDTIQRIEVNAGATLTIPTNQWFVIYGKELIINEQGSIVNSGTVQFMFSSVRNNGLFHNKTDGFLISSATELENNGEIINDGNYSAESGATVTGSGTVTGANADQVEMTVASE